MATGSTSLSTAWRKADVLADLPTAGITEYSQGQTIYSQASPSHSLHWVIGGKVLISQISPDGIEVVLDIIRHDEFFGELVFLDDPHHAEQAIALEAVTAMSWDIAGVEDMVMKRPRLALALLQAIAQRNSELRRRIESLSCETIDCRLARVLIRFNERLGEPEKDGTVRLMPLTHELLARCVGTSREVVTHHMNRFRKQGYVSYSRNGIVLAGDALKTALDQGFAAPAGATLPGTAKTYSAGASAPSGGQRAPSKQ